MTCSPASFRVWRRRTERRKTPRGDNPSTWRRLCFDAADELPELLETGDGKTWTEPDDFVATLLDEDPHAIMDAITDAIEDGATATELARVVTFAAARRIAQFGTSNEFRDWNTVHHTYTYANAVYGLSQRTDAREIYRGVFDAAMNVYLDRFLNMPPTPIPDPNGNRSPDAVLDELMETFEVEANDEVDRAGRLTAEYLEADGDTDLLKRKLGEALLREDVGFHTRQNVEAAFDQYDTLASDGSEEKRTKSANSPDSDRTLPLGAHADATGGRADVPNRGTTAPRRENPRDGLKTAPAAGYFSQLIHAE